MMAYLNASTSVVLSEPSEQRGNFVVDSSINVIQPPMNLQNQTSDGPVAILWDIENCPVPSDVRPEDVAGNIRMALRVHPVIKGAVMMFSAYGDFNAFPRRVREGCQRTGVKLVDVPNGRKDAADKAILVDMFLFALDNPPPSSIMLISGDVDFSPALHILGQRGYMVILVIPSGVGVSSALSNAGKFVWDWPSVARGEGFVPPSKFLMPPRGGATDIAGYFTGLAIGDNPNGQNEEEKILYRGISQNYYNSRDITVVSQSLSSGLNDASGCPGFYDQNDNTWVQPGDLNGLKGQLVKLLELSGGCMPLTRVPAEYHKFFRRPLYVAEYGAFKLVDLFKKMGDTLAIDGKGNKKFVYLRNWKAGPSAPPLVLARKDRKGKGNQEDSMDITVGAGSSDEFSDEEKVIVKELDESRNEGQTNFGATLYDHDNCNLERFKYELQEILVSYNCRIFLGCFEEIYQQRYKKSLDYRKLGAEKLEELFYKVRDVVVLHEEPVSKRKFLRALDG